MSIIGRGAVTLPLLKLMISEFLHVSMLYNGHDMGRSHAPIRAVWTAVAPPAEGWREVRTADMCTHSLVYVGISRLLAPEE